MIIGVCGYKRAGKDTVGDILVTQHGFFKLAFADKGKRVIAGAFGITTGEVEELKNNPEAVVCLHDEDGAEPWRRISFRDFIRDFHNKGLREVYGQGFPVDQLLRPEFAHHGFKYVVCDLRFPLEAMRIKELGGYIIRVDRPGYEGDGHLSEKPDDLTSFVDYGILNDTTIEKLEENVFTIIEKIAEREEKLYNAATGEA